MEIINKEILELAEISQSINISKDKSIIPKDHEIKKILFIVYLIKVKYL
jgi:hypothetical protein